MDESIQDHITDRPKQLVAEAEIITIAPELIEACIALLNSTDYCSDTRPLMQAVRNAVAKVVKNEI